MRNRKMAELSPLTLMALTIFIDFTGFGLVIPLLPFWAERLGAGPQQIGVLLAAYALAQILFTPLLGALSDRVGRKPIILAALIIEGYSFALTALAGSLWLLFVARFISGLGASNIGSAQAVVADVTPPQDRAKAMGAIGAAIGLGFVVGPALGGALVGFGQAVPFWTSMGVALLNALLVWRFLPETRQRRSGAASGAPAPKSMRNALFAGWGRTFRQPAVARLVAINLLYTVAFTGMEAVFVLLTQRTFGWTARQNGYLFAYIGVLIVVMQGGLVGMLVNRFGERVLLIAGLALLAVGLVLIPFSGTLAVLLGALGLVSIGDGAATPTISTLLSFASPDDARGEILGVAQGIGGLGRLLGPLVAGVLFALGASIPFIFGGALVLEAALLAIPAFPRPAQSHTESTEHHKEFAPMQPSHPVATTGNTAPHAKQVLRRAYILGSAITALAILCQIFMAGAGLFADPSWWPMHRMFGMILSIFPLALLALGFAARLPGRALWLTGLVFVLVGLQPVLISAPEQLQMPTLKAFHVVNAVVLFALTAFLGHAAWGRGRETGAHQM